MFMNVRIGLTIDINSSTESIHGERTDIPSPKPQISCLFCEKEVIREKPGTMR